MISIMELPASPILSLLPSTFKRAGKFPDDILAHLRGGRNDYLSFAGEFSKMASTEAEIAEYVLENGGKQSAETAYGVLKLATDSHNALSLLDLLNRHGLPKDARSFAAMGEIKLALKYHSFGFPPPPIERAIPTLSTLIRTGYKFDDDYLLAVFGRFTAEALELKESVALTPTNPGGFSFHPQPMSRLVPSQYRPTYVTQLHGLLWPYYKELFQWLIQEGCQFGSKDITEKIVSVDTLFPVEIFRSLLDFGFTLHGEAILNLFRDLMVHTLSDVGENDFMLDELMGFVTFLSSRSISIPDNALDVFMQELASASKDPARTNGISPSFAKKIVEIALSLGFKLTEDVFERVLSFSDGMAAGLIHFLDEKKCPRNEKEVVRKAAMLACESLRPKTIRALRKLGFPFDLEAIQLLASAYENMDKLS